MDVDIGDLPLPPKMKRDALFECRSPRVQVEFVVDNSALEGLANGNLAITNTTYAQPLHRIRERIAAIFRTCDYKARFLEPVDWRAREWNCTADSLASLAIATKTDGGTLTAELLRETLQQYSAIQCFSDGGFVEGIGGATGVHVVAWNGANRCSVGHAYSFHPEASSAFHMEVSALLAAVTLVHRAAT